MCFVETTNLPSSTNAHNRYFGAFVYFLKYLLLAVLQTLKANQNMVSHGAGPG